MLHQATHSRLHQILYTIITLGAIIIIALLVQKQGHKPARAEINYTVKASHPRVWLTPERITRLKTEAANDSQRWQTVKKLADKGLTDEFDTTYLPDLGLAYQVTGDTKYCKQAITGMIDSAVLSNNLDDDSYFYYRSVMPDMTAGFDWCYSQMSTGERQKIAGWLMDRADAVWPETNPARANGWGLWPANNYFYGFWMTLPAALATQGDDSRSDKHIQLGLAKYTDEVKPWQESWGNGGMFAEGTNYDSTFNLGRVLDSFLTATGQDLVNDTPYLTDSMLWRIYASTPSLDHYYNLGDQSRVSDGPLYDYDRLRAMIPLLDSKDTQRKQYLKHWLDTMEPNISSASFTAPWEFVFYDETAASADYTKSLPLSYLAKGTGTFLNRTNWTDSATYWGIWAGPLGESHQNRDVNGFLIWKDGWLAGNATMWSHSGILNETDNNNNITIDGKGQTWQSDSDGGHIIKTDDGSDYSLFSGWGAEAYNNSADVLDYVRKMVRVGQNTFLVYDRLALTNTKEAKEWHIHSQKPPTITGRNYSFDNGSYRLFGTSLLPLSGVNIKTSNIVDGSTSYSVDVVSTNPAKNDYLLNVLQLSPLANAAPVNPSLINVKAGDLEGGEVEADDGWAVLFGKTELVSGSVHYATTKPRRNHIITDLKPKTAYRLTTGVTNDDQTISTNDKGVARFSIARATDITLTPTDQPVPTSTPPPNGGSTPTSTPPVIIPTTTPTISPSPIVSPTTSPSPTAVPSPVVSDPPVEPTSEPISAPIPNNPSNLPIGQDPTIPVVDEPTSDLAQITLHKTVDKSEAAFGDILTYTIEYENQGENVAYPVIVSDILPRGLFYRRNSASNDGSYSRGTLSWSISALDPHEKGALTFKAWVLRGGQHLNNQASAKYCTVSDSIARCNPGEDTYTKLTKSNSTETNKTGRPMTARVQGLYNNRIKRYVPRFWSLNR
jgi:uncharacterized repeat protein (TIGR01451 family)